MQFSLALVPFCRALTSPRITGKKAPTQPTFQVTMPTGSRSLDKKTIASLVLVRHLGEADRRNMYVICSCLDTRKSTQSALNTHLPNFHLWPCKQGCKTVLMYTLKLWGLLIVQVDKDTQSKQWKIQILLPCSYPITNRQIKQTLLICTFSSIAS